MMLGPILPSGVAAAGGFCGAGGGVGAGGTEVCWGGMLFSAKESVYKAWFPATGQRLGFSDADVELDVTGSFAAHLIVPGPMIGGRRVEAFDGFWAVGRGLVVTAVAVPASRP